MFLQQVQELLLGRRRLLRRDLPLASACPTRRSQWRRDVNPRRPRGGDARQAGRGRQLIRVHRVRGHLHRRPRPAGVEGAGDASPSSIRPPTGSPSGTSTASSSPAALGGERTARPLGDILGVLRDTYCGTIGIEYMHIQQPDEKRWIQQQVEPRATTASSLDDSAASSTELNAAEAFEQFLATRFVGQKRFALEGAESAIPILDDVLEAAADADLDGIGHRHGPPRPAQRPRQHRRQELRPDLPRVRRRRRPRDHPGLGRREVPPRARRQVRQPVRRRDRGRAVAQPQPPRSGRPGRRRHRPRQAGPASTSRAALGDAAPDPRRRRLRRPGRGGRDAAASHAQGLPHRRHHPPGHQQPDRLHHPARSRRALRATPPTSPRWCRRRSST